jgi:hypothetical protein
LQGVRESDRMAAWWQVAHGMWHEAI